MGFIKDKIIYERYATKVYINQCYNPGRKTKAYAVRKDDSYGLGHLLGQIKWSWSWRQYVFFPGSKTFWSADCLNGVLTFLREINQKRRKKK